MAITYIKNIAQYEEFVYGSAGLTVIKYGAQWCGPCKKIAPHFDALSRKFPNVKFGSVDIDTVENAPEMNNMRSIPVFVLFKGGKEVARVVGTLMDALEKYIGTHK